MKNDCGAVIPAGGSSTRFGGENKLLRELRGIPVFIYSLIAFRKVIPERNLVLCVPFSLFNLFSELVQKHLPDSHFIIVPGGKTRVDSVLHGIEVLPPEIEIAAVHDAARPLVTPELINKCYDICRQFGGAAAAVKAVDTVKVYDPETNELLSGGLQRDHLRMVQTPQTFFRKPLLEATRKAAASGISFTDDTSIMEHFAGVRAQMVDSDTPNFKITYAADLEWAEFLLSKH